MTDHVSSPTSAAIPGPVMISLPFSPTSAAVARQVLKEWLVGLGARTETIEDSRLVLSELIGNAVRHAEPLDGDTVQVAWNAEGEEAIDIAVTDGGAPTVPRQVTAATSDESGRGLSIVDSLTNRWWLETTRSRSTVHALIDLAVGAGGPAR